MTRILIAAVALAVPSLPLQSGEGSQTRTKATAPPRERETGAEPKRSVSVKRDNQRKGVVRLNISPMPAPKPALRYLLLPDVRDLTPGNAAQWYMRCFAEQRFFFA